MGWGRSGRVQGEVKVRSWWVEELEVEELEVEVEELEVEVEEVEGWWWMEEEGNHNSVLLCPG